MHSCGKLKLNRLKICFSSQSGRCHEPDACDNSIATTYGIPPHDHDFNTSVYKNTNVAKNMNSYKNNVIPMGKLGKKKQQKLARCM